MDDITKALGLLLMLARELDLDIHLVRTGTIVINGRCGSLYFDDVKKAAEWIDSLTAAKAELVLGKAKAAT